MRRPVWMVSFVVTCLWFLPARLAGQEPEAAAEHVVSATLGAVPHVEAAWPRGEVREYLFQMAGQEVGRQWNQLLVGAEADSGQSYELNFNLHLDLSAIGQPTQMQMDGSLALAPDGRPRAYQLNVSIGEERQMLTATFAEERVQAQVIKGGRESEHSVPFGPDIFVVDNNMIGQWALMLGLLPLKVGEKISQKIFVPQALEEMDIVVEVMGEEPVQVEGIEELTYICQIDPIGEICWVTHSGRMIRLEDAKQRLVVTLLPPGGDAPAEESSGDGFFLRTLPNRCIGYLIYVLVALAWLALLGRGRLGRKDLWLLVVAGGILFPLALSLQVPLQRLYMRWVLVPGTQRGLSFLIVGIGAVALSGIVQELFKFLPVFFRIRPASGLVDGRVVLGLGAAVGVGFGLVEAAMLTDRALALGILSSWAIFERAFAILFHATVSGILALGVWKRASLRYWLLVVFLHSLGNYSVILFRQNLLSPTAVELSVAVFDLCILVGALWITRGGAGDLATDSEETAHA